MFQILSAHAGDAMNRKRIAAGCQGSADIKSQGRACSSGYLAGIETGSYSVRQTCHSQAGELTKSSLLTGEIDNVRRRTSLHSSSGWGRNRELKVLLSINGERGCGGRRPTYVR